MGAQQHAHRRADFYRVKVSAGGDTLADGIYAKITTSLGVMLARLEYEKCHSSSPTLLAWPKVRKFYSKDPRGLPANPDGKPYFDGLIFHRVIKDFMIQGGCPLGNGTGNPGYWLPDQFHPDLKHDPARASSRWPTPASTRTAASFSSRTPRRRGWTSTDIRAGNHSVFGKVVEGMDVVDAIAGVTVSGPNKPKTDVVIESMRIIRVGEKAKEVRGYRGVDRPNAA